MVLGGDFRQNPLKFGRFYAANQPGSGAKAPTNPGRVKKIVAKRAGESYESGHHEPTRITIMSQSIEEKVREIITERLSVTPEKVTAEAKIMEDLGADSLDTVELVMAFEEEFGIDVPDEDSEKLQSVGDVVTYITAHKKD